MGIRTASVQTCVFLHDGVNAYSVAMRTLLSLTMLSFTACQQQPAPMDGGVLDMSHTWAAQTEASPRVFIYGEVNSASMATQPLEFALAFGDAYPKVVTVRPSKPAYLVAGCGTGATWGRSALVDDCRPARRCSALEHRRRSAAG